MENPLLWLFCHLQTLGHTVEAENEPRCADSPPALLGSWEGFWCLFSPLPQFCLSLVGGGRGSLREEAVTSQWPSWDAQRWLYPGRGALPSTSSSGLVEISPSHFLCLLGTRVLILLDLAWLSICSRKPLENPFSLHKAWFAPHSGFDMPPWDWDLHLSHRRWGPLRMVGALCHLTGLYSTLHREGLQFLI